MASAPFLRIGPSVSAPPDLTLCTRLPENCLHGPLLPYFHPCLPRMRDRRLSFPGTHGLRPPFSDGTLPTVRNVHRRQSI